MNKFQSLDITQFLPHRAPFLMVDHVLSIDEEHVATSFLIKEDCIFNDGGFLNEVGLVENAAQTCSSIVGKTYFDEGELLSKPVKLIGFISTIKKVTIHKLPEIGETIITNAKLISRMDTEAYSICTLDCGITSGEKELLSCNLNLVIQELK